MQANGGDVTLEIGIPWTSVGVRDPSALSLIGLNVFVNDNDGNGRKWKEWGTGIARGMSPSEFGTVVLFPDRQAVRCVLTPTNARIANVSSALFSLDAYAFEAGRKLRAQLLASHGDRRVRWSQPFESAEGLAAIPFLLNTAGWEEGQWQVTAQVVAEDDMPLGKARATVSVYSFDRMQQVVEREAEEVWNLAGTGVPSHGEMIQHRDGLLEQFPDLVVIGAHMGHLEHDLGRLGETLDKYPNFHVEMGYRYEALGSQPHTARKFHIKYQDRILFGQDSALSAEWYRHFFRVFEIDDDRFTMGPRNTAMYGLDLPDDVLRKIYYGNAARLMPKVKETLARSHPDLEFPG